MSCRQALNACLICRFYNRCYSRPSYDGFIVSRIKMATKLSTKVGLCTHFSVSGNWMKQCVSCLKYYFTLSLPFEQRLVFRLCCDVQNVVSIILSTQYRFFLRFFLFLTSCHKCLVYDDRANTRLRAPVVRRFVPKELPYHTRHDALLIAFQSSLKAIDCF